MTTFTLWEKPSYEWPPLRSAKGRPFVRTQSSMAATDCPVLHIARNAGRSIVRRLEAGKYWSNFGLPGVRNSTSGIVGNGGSGAKCEACCAARRAVWAASFFASCGFRRISLSKKGCSMGCPWNDSNRRPIVAYNAGSQARRDYARLLHLENQISNLEASFNARKPVRLVLALTSDNGRQFLVCVEPSIGRRPPRRPR